jgi:hypothetical protein
MRKNGLHFGLLVGALGLAACAGISADFTKQGVTKEQVRADNAACRAETEAQVGRDSDITHDIRVGDTRGSQDSSQLFRQTRDAGVARRYDRIFASCMKARGYSQKTD